MRILQDGAADGPANMARDLALLSELVDEPTLRIYHWAGSWVSYGYFQTKEQAAAHFPEAGVQFVKRPTGGGLVDHRNDLTYTLFLPKEHALARLKRAQCYREIHLIVQKALLSSEVPAKLLEEEEGESPACFEHPVAGDLVHGKSGHKLAGAAQRRKREGLIHQGSIAVPELHPKALIAAFTSSPYFTL